MGWRFINSSFVSKIIIHSLNGPPPASFSVFCLYLAVNQPITDVGSDSANYSTSIVTKFTLKIFVDDWALQPKRIVTETFLWCPWIDQLFSTNLKASNRIFNVVDSQEARQYGVVTPGTKAIKPFSLFPIQTKITAKSYFVILGLSYLPKFVKQQTHKGDKPLIRIRK